ncbi:4-(cytidine 5'-diphospho)-2-C-methyl-D-erythritol kinase [Gloeocapsa sp. PCC 73106]|uniref:4-(cytidine 5'-diphospho)-2-C-methyl-D-erythritol kinase n=1 Tax=Gloeocapsa sp. PCC 73106 TaxID=102232 RepID=UPI0002AC19A2|nr:4-(cytidine 5'-diphospho)-2-C-methyl-D-erythritol kinase [Gloeocapsa sp. PCC 73106]ELR97729.1 4-diphosphocytidyl-2-C-methyl-D-erythritol kinase [Gloeocapsa sp. PCC 73106]
MRSYRLIAPAKINLYLEIIGMRTDSYHELVMILQSIDLADLIEIRPSVTDAIKVYCEHPEVPCTPDNLAYKAASLMQRQFPKIAANYGGVNIFIEKHIPVAAGLAGGSANAAAVLVGINMIWELGLTQPELREIAATLGSDVPFCIGGGTAIATGRGEKLDPIPDLTTLAVVLAKYRSLSVSTPWAYGAYREEFGVSYPTDAQSFLKRSQSVHSGPLVQAIVSRDGPQIGKLLHNDLEKVVCPEYPQVSHLRQTMASLGGLGTMMSGSGPTVFTLCASLEEAQSLKTQLINEIANPELDVWTAKLSSSGIHLAQ